jgi:MYXO-CTERM domain-containing protein
VLDSLIARNVQQPKAKGCSAAGGGDASLLALAVLLLALRRKSWRRRESADTVRKYA